jgi:protein gp37
MSTKIQNVTDSWNPIVGCSHVSPGCDRCYAEKMAARINSMNPLLSKYKYVIKDNHWTGTVSIEYKDFQIPFHWNKPRRVFVCSMGDLFHEHVSNEWIDMVMAVIAVNSKHTFMVYTKRPQIMHDYFTAGKDELINRWNLQLSAIRYPYQFPLLSIPNSVQNFWPINNLWLGVTAENQAMANYRVPILLNTLAAKRFISYEPALGPVEFTKIEYFTGVGTHVINALAGVSWYKDIDTKRYDTACHKLDWVICGSESGPGHRNMELDWAENVKDQCERNKIPFFFKQRYIGSKKISMPQINGKVYNQIPQ